MVLRREGNYQDMFSWSAQWFWWWVCGGLWILGGPLWPLCSDVPKPLLAAGMSSSHPLSEHILVSRIPSSFSCRTENVLAVPRWGDLDAIVARPRSSGTSHIVAATSAVFHHRQSRSRVRIRTRSSVGSRFGFSLIILGCLSTVYTLWRNSLGFKGRL